LNAASWCSKPRPRKRRRSTRGAPVAVAQLHGYRISLKPSRAYGVYACKGVLSNHKNRVRGEKLATRNIARVVALAALHRVRNSLTDHAPTFRPTGGDVGHHLERWPMTKWYFDGARASCIYRANEPMRFSCLTTSADRSSCMQPVISPRN